MSVINTNMKSLITQNNLTVNNRALSSAMEKLSTGKRINTAGDDAAGLAISNKMTAQIRGLNQSVRNANDGISMIQTAEGALTEVTNMLQRMRELAVQSANDTNTSSDRFALDLEYQQLGREISRIATNTQWNAMNILNNTEVGVAGSAADVGVGVRNVKFQVGANPNQVINIGLKDFSYNLGVSAVASESKFSLGGVDLTGAKVFKISMALITNTNGVNSQSAVGVTTSSPAITADQDFSVTLSRAVVGASMTEEELVDLETKLNKAITDIGPNASGDPGFQNVSVTRVGTDIYIKDAEGRKIGTLEAFLASGTSATTGTIATDSTLNGLNGTIAVAAIDPGSANAKSVFSGSARLNDTQIKTQAGANQAVARLDNAMANVDHELATFGSVMNRLTFAGDNLTNVSQNTQQSRSRVLDTDYAAATTELARTQIIQQAGMAMLAQANQQPQTVLSLLQ
jgi:flagellin